MFPQCEKCPSCSLVDTAVNLRFQRENRRVLYSRRPLLLGDHERSPTVEVRVVPNPITCLVWTFPHVDPLIALYNEGRLALVEQCLAHLLWVWVLLIKRDGWEILDVMVVVWLLWCGNARWEGGFKWLLLW